MSILVLTSDTLIGTPATGNLEYNGQFYGTDSALSRAQMQRIAQGTAVASTSGTSIDFTGLPAWVKRITINFIGTSLSGTSNILVQLGAGSVTTTGYTAISNGMNSTGTGNVYSTSGMPVYLGAAASTAIVSVVINLATGTTWISSHSIFSSSITSACGGGALALGGTLDRVRITTVNGTDTFDAGSINILYEG